MRIRSSIRQVSLLVLATSVGGSCTLEPPFERVNPMDEGSVYAIDVEGPDSAHYVGQELQYEIVSEPFFPASEYAIRWDPLPHIACLPRFSPNCNGAAISLAASTGGGGIRIIDANAEYRRIVVSAHFDRRQVGKDVVVGQRVGEIDVTVCRSLNYPNVSCATPLPRDSDIVLTLQATDIGGAPVKDLRYGLDRVQLTSRDPTVLMTVPPTIQLAVATVRLIPIGPGTTWAVLRMDQAVDSVRLTIAP